jgi:hypothetical protein
MVTKWRRMSWAGHVAHMEEIINAYNILVGEPKGRDHSEVLGVDGKIILECILGKYGGKVWCIRLRIGTYGGPLLTW